MGVCFAEEMFQDLTPTSWPPIYMFLQGFEVDQDDLEDDNPSTMKTNKSHVSASDASAEVSTETNTGGSTEAISLSTQQPQHLPNSTKTEEPPPSMGTSAYDMVPMDAQGGALQLNDPPISELGAPTATDLTTPMEVEDKEDEPIDIMTNEKSPPGNIQNTQENIQELLPAEDVAKPLVSPAKGVQPPPGAGVESLATIPISKQEIIHHSHVNKALNVVPEAVVPLVEVANAEEMNSGQAVEAVPVAMMEPQEQLSLAPAKVLEGSGVAAMDTSPVKQMKEPVEVQHCNVHMDVAEATMGANKANGSATLVAAVPIPLSPSAGKQSKEGNVIHPHKSLAATEVTPENILQVAPSPRPAAPAQVPSAPSSTPLPAASLTPNAQSQLPGGLLVRSFKPAQVHKPSRLSRLGPGGATPQRGVPGASTPQGVSPMQTTPAAKTPFSITLGAMRPSLTATKADTGVETPFMATKPQTITPSQAAFPRFPGAAQASHSKTTNDTLTTPSAPIKQTKKLESNHYVSATPVPFTPEGNGNGAAITPATAYSNDTPGTTPVPIQAKPNVCSIFNAPVPTPQNGMNTNHAQPPANVAISSTHQAKPVTSSPATHTTPQVLLSTNNDSLLQIDFSARGDRFLAGLDDEIAATQATLAINVSDKAFSLSTTVATTAVERESLGKKVEEVEGELSMLRVKYSLDAAEAVVRGAVAIDSRKKSDHEMVCLPRQETCETTAINAGTMSDRMMEMIAEEDESMEVDIEG